MNYSHLCINCMNEKPGNDRYCRFCGFDESRYTCPEQGLPPYTILNGRYILGRILGSGGFGITYIALDTTLDKVVAVKEFFYSHGMYRNSSISPCITTPAISGSEKTVYDANRRKFKEEAKILAKLDPVPGIVRVHHLFEENNTLYFVMDYLSGVTLKEYCAENGRMSFQETVRLMIPMMDALNDLHQRGVYHRDISPDNIMVSKEKSLTLFDFGGAKLQSKGGHSRVITAKAGYSPVEQLQYAGQVGPWTDVYSLSATIYYCITGLVPPPASVRVGNENALIRPRAAAAGITPEQEKALLRGMAVSYNDRYQSMAELKAALLRSESSSGRAHHKALIAGALLGAAGLACLFFLFVKRPVIDSQEFANVSSQSESEAAETLTPEPTPTEIPTPEPAETEEATPEPAETEEKTPEPAGTKETTPEPTVTEEATPEPTPTEIPTPDPTEIPVKSLPLVMPTEYHSSDDLLDIVKESAGISVSWRSSYDLQYVYAPQKDRGIGITGYPRTETLSACRYDFDRDGQEEILAVVFEGVGTRQEDNNLLLLMLEQYEAGGWDASEHLLLEFPIIQEEGEQNIYIGNPEDGGPVLLVQNKADGEVSFDVYRYENRMFGTVNDPGLTASAEETRFDLSNAVVSCSLRAENGSVFQDPSDGIKEWETLDRLKMTWADAGGADVRRIKTGIQSKPLLTSSLPKLYASENLLDIVKETAGLSTPVTDSYSLQYVHAPRKSRGIGITGYTETEILSACRYDFDRDGQEEILAVLFEGAGTRQEDNNLVLIILEPNPSGGWAESGSLALDFPIVKTSGEQDIYIGSLAGGGAAMLVRNVADGKTSFSGHVYDNGEFKPWEDPENLISAEKNLQDAAKLIVSCSLYPDKGSVYQKRTENVQEWETLDLLRIIWFDHMGINSPN